MTGDFRLPHAYYEAQSADQRWWLFWQPKTEALRQQRALWNTLVDLKEYVMSSAENMVARLNAATDDIAGDLRTIRDQLANVQAASESEKAAAVDAALAQFEGPISRLEALGRDEANPVPEQPSEPVADGSTSGELPDDAAGVVGYTADGSGADPREPCSPLTGPPAPSSPAVGPGGPPRTGGRQVPIKRYPDWDPRSWSGPFQDPPTEPRRPAVTGQWVEDPRERSGWRWDGNAPAGDPSPTLIQNAPVPAAHELGTPRREPAVTQLDPTSGGGLMPSTHTPPPVPGDDEQEDVHLPQSMGGLDGTQLAICPNCGSGVAASRLRQQD